MFDSYLPASALNLRTPPAKAYVVTREVQQELKPVMVGLTLSKFTAKRRGQKFREIDVIRFKGENWVKLDDLILIPESDEDRELAAKEAADNEKLDQIAKAKVRAIALGLTEAELELIKDEDRALERSKSPVGRLFG